ncbi:MAG: outer membrane beta-barrel protein [Thermodesulfobacteriota bacterium]|nr:outer membrane beta-barrel protein [Thermodesulfobacteriota bacterium]
MAYFNKIIFLISLVGLVFVFSDGVIADEFKLIPSIAVREEYNDNILYTSSDEVDDWITTISPGLELIQRTERLDLNLSATVSPIFYADHSDFDDVDQNYRARGNYQLTSLMGVNATALYDVSNRPDRDIETTGMLESVDERKRQEYGFGIDYKLTEIAAMTLSLGYMRDKWDSKDLDRQDLKAPTANLNFTYNLGQWWESTISRLNFGFGRYEYEYTDTYNYFGSVGVQHWFSETVNLLVDLGVRYTDSDFYRPQLVFVPPSSYQVRIVKDNSTDFGGVGQAILEIQREITRGSIRIAYDIRPASGDGTVLKRTDVVLNLSRRFAESSVIAISTGFFKNKAGRDEFSFQKTDEDTFFIRPRIRWEFFDNYTLEAGYNFSYVDDRVENEDKRRNLVYLQVAYGLPLFE